MARITENQLSLPSLFLMSLSSTKGLSTADLIPKLRDLLKPSGEDLKILAGRNDDKFSQKVRNLKAYNTFERYNFVFCNCSLRHNLCYMEIQRNCCKIIYRK